MTCTVCAALEHSIELAERYHDSVMKVSNQKRLHAHLREAHST